MNGPIILLAILGVANGFIQAAMLASSHPAVAQTLAALRPIGGRRAAHAFEVLVLIAAMAFAKAGSASVTLFYAVYTAINAVGLWALSQSPPR